MYWVQRVQMESLENHLFFATLTYNQESLPRLLTSTGYEIPYADVRDLQNCFKRIEKKNGFTRPFRWFAVSERGSKFGRPHFHVLFSIPRYESDTYFTCLNLEEVMFQALLSEWRRNCAAPVWSEKRQKYVPNTRSPDYRPLCTYFRKFYAGRLSSNYDLHYCDPYTTDNGLADVAFYCLKYMLKPSTRETRLQQALHLNLPEDEYEDVWPIVKSSRYVSHDYGNNASALCHIVKSIDTGLYEGKYPYPVYINPDSGQTFPLAPYYRKKDIYFPYSKALEFYYRSPSVTVDTIHDVDKKSIDQFYNSIHKYEKIISSQRLDFLDSLSSIE